jgi:hypothetical protein
MDDPTIALRTKCVSCDQEFSDGVILISVFPYFLIPFFCILYPCVVAIVAPPFCFSVFTEALLSAFLCFCKS